MVANLVLLRKDLHHLPLYYGERREGSLTPPMTENGGKKDNTSSYLSQEDNVLSKHEMKRLVKLGREVERNREESLNDWLCEIGITVQIQFTSS